MNQEDISYKDSLMSYAKGLGPIAEMVAKRKLLGQHEANKHRTGSDKTPDSGGFRAKEFKTFRDFTGGNPFLKVIDFTKDEEAANIRDKKGKEKSETEHDQNRGKQRSETENDQNRGKQKCERDNDKNKGKEKSETMKRIALPVCRELSCLTSKSNDDGRPVVLALESAHSEFKARIRRNSVVSTRPPLPIVSRFTFDLPFLKARLSQMNAAVKRGGKLQC